MQKTPNILQKGLLAPDNSSYRCHWVNSGVQVWLSRGQSACSNKVAKGGRWLRDPGVPPYIHDVHLQNKKHHPYSRPCGDRALRQSWLQTFFPRRDPPFFHRVPGHPPTNLLLLSWDRVNVAHGTVISQDWVWKVASLGLLRFNVCASVLQNGSKSEQVLPSTLD